MLSSTIMFSCTCQHFTADITLYIVIKAFITPNFSNGWILENLRKWQNLKPFIIYTNSPSLRFLQLKVPILEEKIKPKKVYIYIYNYNLGFDRLFLSQIYNKNTHKICLGMCVCIYVRVCLFLSSLIGVMEQWICKLTRKVSERGTRHSRILEHPRTASNQYNDPGHTLKQFQISVI